MLRDVTMGATNGNELAVPPGIGSSRPGGLDVTFGEYGRRGRLAVVAAGWLHVSTHLSFASSMAICCNRSSSCAPSTRSPCSLSDFSVRELWMIASSCRAYASEGMPMASATPPGFAETVWTATRFCPTPRAAPRSLPRLEGLSISPSLGSGSSCA